MMISAVVFKNCCHVRKILQFLEAVTGGVLKKGVFKKSV